MSISSSEVCVVGGGVIGLAVACALRDRGVDVVCLERGVPGDGQSLGRTRQFRHLHRDPALIELAVRARSGWLEWQERFGRPLLGTEGALRIGAEPLELDALRAAGVPAVELGAQQAAERFPIALLGERAKLGEGMILWDPLAGAIRAADTVAALADHLGPSLRRADVGSLVIGSAGAWVEARTSDGLHRSTRCVVCAGAGTDRLVRGLGLAVHQDRQAHLRLAFRTRVAPALPLPCFSDRSSEAGELVYGLIDLEDRYAVGLATVTTYPAVEDLALDVPDGVELASQRARIIEYARRALPGLEPRPVAEVLRLTTTLPEHPEDGFEFYREGPVIAVAGPNLFKFAPVIGEQLARMATSDDAISPAETVGRVS
jgi:glycine/D-amino acid oxidase-like deaminating enzyme